MPNHTRPQSSQIARRAVLRGAGVTMALPWLESFAAKAAAADPVFPKRFGVVFLGCGVNEDHWGSEGSGAEMKLSKSLSPLEPLKGKINVIHGLFNKGAMGLGIHPPQTGSLLTGRLREIASPSSRSCGGISAFPPGASVPPGNDGWCPVCCV